MPTAEGQHRVIVKFIGNEIPKSPFNVLVEGYAGDPNKVTASGPGLEPVGVVVSKPTYFDIFTHGEGGAASTSSLHGEGGGGLGTFRTLRVGAAVGERGEEGRFVVCLDDESRWDVGKHS